MDEPVVGNSLSSTNDELLVRQQNKTSDTSLSLASAFQLAKDGRTDEAWAILRRAGTQSVTSDHPATHLLEGMLRQQQGQWKTAEQSLLRALDHRPGWPAAERILGLCLANQHRHEEAVSILRRVVERSNHDVDARLALAVALFRMDRFDEAVAAFRGALDSGQRKERVEEILSSLLITASLVDRHEPALIMMLHRKLGELFEYGIDISSDRHKNSRNPNRRLKIAYVGPNFGRHGLMTGVEPLLRFHDRGQFHVSVYAHVPAPDDKTHMLREMVDHWAFIQDLSDDEVAARIRSDAVDILVHTMGHWRDNRIAVLARRPAPIQVTYSCNSPTSGLSTVDYLIADQWLNGDGFMSRHCVERVIELPSGFNVLSDKPELPIEPIPPSERLGYPTFGSFNSPTKLSGAVLELWASIINQCEGSRLLVKGKLFDTAEGVAQFKERFFRAGGNIDRLDFAGWCSTVEHFDYHNRIDLALDTFPFVGGTTTMDSLWMGVPVVTFVGQAPYSRYSYDYLRRIDAAELCAQSTEDYVRIAIDLATDLYRLRHYRQDLRSRLKQSSLFDQRRHVRDLDRAFRDMWLRWCTMPAASP